MDPNFPREGLSIHASDPVSALRHFTATDTAWKSEHPGLEDELVITSQTADIKAYGIAGRVWEAAYAMTLYIDPPRSCEYEPQCSISRARGAVLELGAGTGFLGFKLARILSLPWNACAPKPLILTDMETVCPLLARNCQQDRIMTDLPGVNLLIRTLEWGNLQHGLELATELTRDDPCAGVPDHADALLSHIVCSDLVFFTELFAPLIRTLLQLSSPPFSTPAQPVEIIISYMIRSLAKESAFWSAFGTWFNFSPVLVRPKSDESSNQWERFGGHGDGTMFIFVATRKLETLGRAIPDDLDLLKGADETFETILLMNISNSE